MRLLQNVLLVIGASALGVVSCVVLAFFATATVAAPRFGQDPSLNWGAAFVFTFLGISGGIFGAIAGFVGALRWITQRGSEPWTLTIWIGAVLGLATALVIRFSGALDRYVLGDLIKWWPGMALFLAAAASLGGFIGGIAGARGKRQVARWMSRGEGQRRHQEPD